MRDPHDQDAPLPRIEECGAQAFVRTERVVASVSAPAFLSDDPSSGAGVEDIDEDFDDRRGVIWTASAGRSVAIALVAGFAAGFALHDIRAGLAVAIVAWLLQEMRVVVEMFPFSVGDAFLGYRGDQGWPQGVQEDDDLKWSWGPPTNAQQQGRRAAIAGK
jgi:hypothetical protein